MIAALVETGEVYYMFHEGATDSQMVLTFVTQVTRILGNRQHRTIAWFGDNASWQGEMVTCHLPKGVLWMKNAKGAPQLSPIENLFGQVRSTTECPTSRR